MVGLLYDVHGNLPALEAVLADARSAAVGRWVGAGHVALLVFGHTHLPFAREARGLRLVNPGSVGMPLDGDHRAGWAVIGDDGRVEHRRVAYDHEHSAAALRERFGDKEWTHALAERVR